MICGESECVCVRVCPCRATPNPSSTLLVKVQCSNHYCVRTTPYTIYCLTSLSLTFPHAFPSKEEHLKQHFALPV